MTIKDDHPPPPPPPLKSNEPITERIGPVRPRYTRGIPDVAGVRAHLAAHGDASYTHPVAHYHVRLGDHVVDVNLFFDDDDRLRSDVIGDHTIEHLASGEWAPVDAEGRPV